jgi:hypothetical protein
LLVIFLIVFLVVFLRLLSLVLTLVVPFVLLFFLVSTFVIRPACRLDELKAFFTIICVFAQFGGNISPFIAGVLHIYEGLVLFGSEHGGSLGLFFLFRSRGIIE